MITTNMVIQLLFVLGQYQKKSTAVKLKEALICLMFLRPAVDAYRVSTNLEDDELKINSLTEMMSNKAVELATESIPGCVLQIYVWLKSPDEAGSFALVSIGVSALTTGFASAMISFDSDVDVAHRKNQSKMYGYIPNDNGERGLCFVLMTLISALHNVSRSAGCALLAAAPGNNLVMLFVGGELTLYMFYKMLRNDFYYWPRLDGAVAVIVGFCNLIVSKVIADFSGCLHFRHPCELGGLAFSASIIWAQAFPFVALQFFEGEKEIITTVLMGSFGLWLLLNIAFFSTIDLSFIATFFTTTTAPQYTCGLFLEGENDAERFSTAFETRISYTKGIYENIKEWVKSNIARWKVEKPSWFTIEIIPDEFLPRAVFEAEGGANRRKQSSFGLSRTLGLSTTSLTSA